MMVGLHINTTEDGVILIDLEFDMIGGFMDLTGIRRMTRSDDKTLDFDYNNVSMMYLNSKNRSSSVMYWCYLGLRFHRLRIITRRISLRDLYL
jgi:hypothetical protein